MKRKISFLITLVTLLTFTAIPMATSRPLVIPLNQNFYSVPKNFKNYPAGHLLKQQKIIPTGSVNIGGKGFPLDVDRIMYTSRDQNNKPVVVTGYITRNPLPWVGREKRPLLAIAPETKGGGDSCALSKLYTGDSLGHGISGPNVDGTVHVQAYFLSKGYDLAVTDYQGIGTPGDQPFAVRLDQGHVMLDLLRAAKQLTNFKVYPSTPMLMWGYSQGGGAAAAAAELAHSYAPELPLKAVYAGGVPSDLMQVLPLLDGTSGSGLLLHAIGSFGQAYPVIGKFLDRVLNNRGKQEINDVRHQCAMYLNLLHVFEPTSVLTKSGKTITQLIYEDPQVLQIIRSQTLGKAKPSMPVLLHTSPQDDIIPAGQVIDLANRWKGMGARVELVSNPLPPILSGTSVPHLENNPVGIALGANFFTKILAENYGTNGSYSILGS